MTEVRTEGYQMLIERKRALEDKRRETIEQAYNLLKKISENDRNLEMPTVMRLSESSKFINEITKFIFTNYNILKLQEWTGKRFGNVLFDSKEKMWSQNLSEFADNILGRRNLVICVIDKNRNMFGGYVSGNIQIQQKCGDDTSFMFKFPSPNNRNIEQFKLLPNATGNVFYIESVESSNLFEFGDITVVKKGYHGGSRFVQQYFDYGNSSLIGSGEFEFTAERIIVGEMIDM